MYGRNNQNRKQILAKFLFSSSKINNCQFKVYMYLLYLPAYFPAAAFSGTSIKDHGNSQSGKQQQYDGNRRRNNGKVGRCLAKIVSFHPFGTECILMKKTPSLSPQLLFAEFSRWKAPCVLPGFLLSPPAIAARFSDVPTSAEANTIDMGGSPQCRRKSRNQHGLPLIVEATVRLRATLTSRGYFQHVLRETC